MLVPSGAAFGGRARSGASRRRPADAGRRRTSPGGLAFVLLLPLVVCGARGQERSSASYELTVEGNGAAGGLASSASYTLNASTSDSGGVSDSAASGIVAKTGFTGRLYDVETLSVSATPGIVNETGTSQLDSVATLDDATTLELAGSDPSWMIVSGPITWIDSDGVATAGIVYQDTPALVEGSFLGVSGQAGLTVLNTDDDNFDGYAGDKLDDSWQVLNFGAPPNPDAAPDQNPDGDPADNLFEFLTGFNPNDPGDFFTFRIVGVSGTTASFELNKVIPDRSYTLRAGLDPANLSETVANFGVVSEAADHPVQDDNATAGRRFYAIEVTGP